MEEFLCTVCNATFRSKSGLATHSRKHKRDALKELITSHEHQPESTPVQPQPTQPREVNDVTKDKEGKSKPARPSSDNTFDVQEQVMPSDVEQSDLESGTDTQEPTVAKRSAYHLSFDIDDSDDADDMQQYKKEDHEDDDRDDRDDMDDHEEDDDDDEDDVDDHDDDDLEDDEHAEDTQSDDEGDLVRQELEAELQQYLDIGSVDEIHAWLQELQQIRTEHRQYKSASSQANAQMSKMQQEWREEKQRWEEESERLKAECKKYKSSQADVSNHKRVKELESKITRLTLQLEESGEEKDQLRLALQQYKSIGSVAQINTFIDIYQKIQKEYNDVCTRYAWLEELTHKYLSAASTGHVATATSVSRKQRSDETFVDEDEEEEVHTRRQKYRESAQVEHSRRKR